MYSSQWVLLKALAPSQPAAHAALDRQWHRYLEAQGTHVESGKEYTRLEEQVQTWTHAQLTTGHPQPEFDPEDQSQRAAAIAYVAVEDYDHFIRVAMVCGMQYLYHHRLR